MNCVLSRYHKLVLIIIKMITTRIHQERGKVLARTTNNLILQSLIANGKKAFTKETNGQAKDFEGKMYAPLKQKFLKTGFASDFFK